MARTTINSQGVPAGTITASDLTFPLADFSSTGIDDNATSTAITIDSDENIGIGISPSSTYGRLRVGDGNSDIDMDANAKGQFHIDGNAYGFGIALNTSGAQLYTNSASRDLIFGTDETERMRINGSGNITVTGTVDGRDLATDGAKLDNIEANADVTDTINVTAAGALMDSELTDLAGVKAVTISTLQPKPSEGAFANGDKTKLDGIATGADVTPSWVPSSDPSYLTSVPAQSFASLTGKPTTIAGYGITDAFDGAYGSLTGTPTIPTNNNQLTNGAGYITSFDITTQTDSKYLRSDVDDQMLAQLYGGFGAVTTGGTTDWNHSTNARSGGGYTLLTGNATNGPGGGTYYHPFSFEYNSKGGTGNMTQLAIPYNGSSIWHRYRYSSSWTSWLQEWNSGNDGSGSGLDADTVDGVQASGLMQLGTSSTSTATQVFSIAAGQPMLWRDTNATNGTNCNIYSYWYAQSTTLGYIGYGSAADSNLYLSNASVGSIYLASTSANGFLANGSIMWHAGNDGSGSGLDADLWDGNQFSSYLNQALLTTSNPTFATINYNNALYAYEGSNYVAQDPRWNQSGYNANEGVHHMYCTTASGGTYGQVGMALYSGSSYVYLTTKSGDTNFYHNNSKIWSAGNDGSGSGLDADTLDGYNSGTSGANITLRTNSSGYLAHSNWILLGNGTGLYMGNGGYFYQDTTYGWYSRSPNSSNSSIRLQNSSGTNIGWWYASNSYVQGFLNSSGGYSFQVDNSGNATATGNVTAYSDIRLKENIQPLENSLDKVMRLRGVSYTRKDTGSHEIGVIAQEVKEVIPEFVHISDGVAEDENALTDVQSVDYGRMVSVLIEAIKEQQAQINELKEKIKWQ